jgi:hypothetical protein
MTVRVHAAGWYPGRAAGPAGGQLAKGAGQMHSSATVWRTSSHSKGNCVEIAWRQGAEGINIVVRDSKFPGRDPLVFTPGEWAVFLDRVKSEDFDVLAGPRAAEWGHVLPDPQAHPVSEAP